MIAEEPREADQPEIVHVPLGRIRPSPRNPREKLPGIDELAESIRAYGLLQPVVLRPAANGFELVAGHRRFAAVQALGWDAIPAVIRDADADQAYLLTLIENLQRDDLSPREQSRALEVLVREHGWSTRQVAQAVKRSPSYVSKRLRVFDDPVLAEIVLSNRLSVSAAEELLPLPLARKKALAQRAAEGRWEPHQVRAAVTGSFKGTPHRRPRLSTRVRELRQMLKDVSTSDLTDADREELRRLFNDLVVLARAPARPGQVILPPLPQQQSARRR